MNIFDPPIFIIFILVVLYPLGNLALKFLVPNLAFWESLLLSLNLGSVFFTILSFILGLLKNQMLVYPLILIVLLLNIFRLKINPVNLRVNPILMFIILMVVSIQCLISVTSYISDSEYRLLGAHNKDSLWHISIINNLTKNIPPENPLMSGVEFTNYHYFLHLFIAQAHQITAIPVPNLYFKLVPVFLLVLFSSSLYLLVSKLTNRLYGYFAVILSLGSNLYYFLPIIYSKAYFSPSNLWIDEYSTRLVNLQLLSSYIIILTLLIFLLVIKNWDLKKAIILAIISGSLVGFKSQASVVWIGALVAVSILNFRNIYLLLLSLGTIAVTFLTLALTTKLKGSIFILEPLWFIRTMYQTVDHVNFVDWELKRQTYLAEKNYLRVTQLYIDGLVVFLSLNFGPKLIGFFAIFKNYGDETKVILMLTFMSVVGLVLPMLVITQGVAWNSIQFSYYSTLFLSLLLIYLVFKLFKDKGIVILTIIFIFFLPGVIQTTLDYLPKETGRSNDLFQAAIILSEKEDGVVLADPSLTENSLIPAVSKKSLYYSQDPSLDVQLGDRSREAEVKEFFIKDRDFQLDFLKKNNIRFIITASSLDFSNMEKIGKLFIYQVN